MSAGKPPGTGRFCIGTRGSPLALAQARAVRDLVRGHHPGLDVSLEVIRTSGDRFLDRNLSEIGGKGLFTKEIEEALIEGRIDIAVHSMKDVPTWLPEGLGIFCMLEREDPRDVLIAPKAHGIDDLAPGAVVGTASLRRKALILRRRPDLKVVPFRGNVQTRLAKLERGEADATLLALAGLKRLGLADDLISRGLGTILGLDDMLPAPSQGAVGIECRSDDDGVRQLLAPLNHEPTRVRVAAERSALEAVDGSCRTPIAALAEFADADGDDLDVEAATLDLRVLVAKPDGSAVLETTRQGPGRDAAALGRDAGAELARAAGPGFFDEAPAVPAGG